MPQAFTDRSGLSGMSGSQHDVVVKCYTRYLVDGVGVTSRMKILWNLFVRYFGQSYICSTSLTVRSEGKKEEFCFCFAFSPLSLC